MDKKSKILFAVFFIAALAAIGISFYKYYLLEDFYISAEKDCDPKGEGCFMRECDPASDTGCPMNGEKRIIYYTLITKKASAIQKCDPKYPNCTALDCRKEDGCTEILCDETTKGEEKTCNDPEAYLKSLEQGSQPENNYLDNSQE